MPEGSAFEIPARPERRFPAHGGVTYEGGTTFVLRPETTLSDAVLAQRLESVLRNGPYRFGDFLNLPMTLYLVNDRETTDVFRVGVRDGTIQVHVLPETEKQGLAALYDRLQAASDTDWTVERRLEAG